MFIGLRLTLAFGAFLAFVVSTRGQTVSSCSPEVPRYAEWSASRHFPYERGAAKEQEMAAKLSQLTLGLSEQQVKAMVGSPDFANDGSLQPNAIACSWFYVFEDQGPTTDPMDKQVVALGFSDKGSLAAVRSAHVNGVKTLEPVDKSCEPYSSPTARTIKTMIDSGRLYVAQEDRQARIRAGYSHLSLGTSIEETELLLGSPDSVNVTRYGFVGSNLALGIPCKRQLVYILRQSSNNPLDPNTAAIYLTFDKDKLFWAAPENVSGMQTIGSPTQ